MKFYNIDSAKALAQVVEEAGFLPYFANKIMGFSIEEQIDRRYWFSEEEGAWEWKGPVIRATGCAYGKFFGGRACYISKKWFPDFANWRRQGFDLDAAFDTGRAKQIDLETWNTLRDHGSLLSKELKREAGFGRDGKKGFDAVITRLQMECYVVTSDFEYSIDKYGAPYGWGVARYQTPEDLFGKRFTSKVYARSPEESKERIMKHLSKLFPATDTKLLEEFLKGGIRE